MSGLHGMSRLPRDTVRARRNATKFASDFTSLLGDGLTVTASLIVVDLAATPGLEFSGGDLIAKVAAPIALDATGIHLDFGTGLQNDAGVLKTKDTEIDHDDLLNFLGNEHIDWTNATDNLVTTGYVDAGSFYLSNLKVLHGTSVLKNIFLGRGVAPSITTGYYNTVVGEDAGVALTEGYQNTLIGDRAGTAIIGGYSNTYLGSRAGLDTTTGYRNTAIGDEALANIIGGHSNVGLGRQAGLDITSGTNNLAIGSNALGTVTTGSVNIGIGSSAGGHLGGASANNVYIGFQAGYGVIGNDNNDNVAIGYTALIGITTGKYNVAIGSEALYAVPNKWGNVGIGRRAGKGQSTQSYNTYIGDLAGATAHAWSAVIAIGRNAEPTANNQCVIGSETGPVTDLYVGEGATSTTPQDFTFHTTDGSGTDIATGDLIVAGGRSTGDADPGDILFKTTDTGASGVALQTLATRMTISDTAVTMHKGLVIPSGTAPAPAVEGALFLDTDAGVNGTLVCYSNGAWRTVTAF